MTPLGEYLRSQRQSRGITQKEMAAGIGVSAAYLSALEHGDRGLPSFALLQRITGYLNVIWDEADQLQLVAELSDPKVEVDTRKLSAKATQVANILARDIASKDDKQLDVLLAVLTGQKPRFT